MAKVIMVQGTMSGAGKSLLCTAARAGHAGGSGGCEAFRAYESHPVETDQ